jgi:hypothetical protein
VIGVGGGLHGVAVERIAHLERQVDIDPALKPVAQRVHAEDLQRADHDRGALLDPEGDVDVAQLAPQVVSITTCG